MLSLLCAEATTYHINRLTSKNYTTAAVHRYDSCVRQVLVKPLSKKIKSWKNVGSIDLEQQQERKTSPMTVPLAAAKRRCFGEGGGQKPAHTSELARATAPPATGVGLGFISDVTLVYSCFCHMVQHDFSNPHRVVCPASAESHLQTEEGYAQRPDYLLLSS
ncbi:uncharacterized protein J5F26_000056 isoform 1-T2 [Ciconia maguari]